MGSEGLGSGESVGRLASPKHCQGTLSQGTLSEFPIIVCHGEVHGDAQKSITEHLKLWLRKIFFSIFLKIFAAAAAAAGTRDGG